MSTVWQQRLWAHRSTAIWVLLSLLGAGLAVWSSSRYLADKTQELEARAAVPMVARLVAARSLPVGAILGSEDVAIRDFPQHLISSDSLSPEYFLAIENQKLAHALVAGDLILPAHVREQEPDRFSSILRPGRRALTIPADVLSSVAGLLQAGDLIDVYVSFDYQRRRISSPLLQGVRVLAINRNTEYLSESRYEASTLTLDVSPEEGVTLLAARQAGTLTAMLRPVGDAGRSDRAIRGDLAALLGLATSSPTRAKKSAPVVYGNQQNRTLQALVASTAAASPSKALFSLPAQAYGLENMSEQAAAPWADWTERNAAEAIVLQGEEYE
ncbi:Flp pilus assembly protein CpaB [Paenalcaligenes sp. Me131]|uniref:Flp pilus assembly protein CpaB n=1 Tax=Paenalcaligenes sp. Me131 TaxID=3392636 RepID=UPI003D2BE3D3